MAEEAMPDPFVLFGAWLEEAAATEPDDPNAMAIATADASGVPNVRMVLLKGFDASGFVFYTNIESRKGTELRSNMHAAGALHWKTLHRQVRFRGQVDVVTDSEADSYFASRDRNSRIGAWASQQSRPLESRSALEEAVARQTARFRTEELVRPPYWTGLRVKPVYIEFWCQRPYRLHDRLAFERDKPGAEWSVTRLYP